MYRYTNVHLLSICNEYRTEFIFSQSQRGPAHSYPMNTIHHVVPPIHAFPRKCRFLHTLRSIQTAIVLVCIYIYI